MTNPRAHFVRYPLEGGPASLGAARREAWVTNPRAHFVRYPLEGGPASLGAARREA
jgi:hypothetical protein